MNINQDTTNWDQRFLTLASHIASWSRDKSAKTGAIIADDNRIIRSTGYNGFPKGVNDKVASRYERPSKYLWTEHAERNAIYNAARTGQSIEGCTIYINWFPCADCARAIIQTGLKRVVGLNSETIDRQWDEAFSFTKELFSEVGIQVKLYQLDSLHARSL